MSQHSPTYCGGSTCHGHGEYALCGQPYYGKTYQCSTCELADRDKTITALQKEATVLRNERGYARAQVERAAKILTSIHALLYPEPIEIAGQAHVFRPSSPDPHEVLQALSDRIRAIPEEIAALEAGHGVDVERVLTALGHVRVPNTRCLARVAETPPEDRPPGPQNPPMYCCLTEGHDGPHRHNGGGMYPSIPFRDTDKVVMGPPLPDYCEKCNRVWPCDDAKAVTRALGNGWTARRDDELRLWWVYSPSGAAAGIYDQAAGVHAELLRQLAQCLPASAEPGKEQCHD